MRIVRIFLLCMSIGVLSVQASSAENLWYPSVVGGHIDFAGMRFHRIDRSTKKAGLHLSRPMMKEKVLILVENKSGHMKGGALWGVPPKMYLVKIQKQSKEARRAGRFDIKLVEGDTLIRPVQTLNDLRGYVKIRTETDALDFVRLGSSMLWASSFEHDFEEVFCVRPEDTKGMDPDVMWGTTDECRGVGFAAPQIVPLVRESPRSDDAEKDVRKQRGADGDDGEPSKETEDDEENLFFLITRNVYSTKNNIHQFLRVTEEVGSKGQWRLLSSIFLAEPDEAHAVFYGVDARPENSGRP